MLTMSIIVDDAGELMVTESNNRDEGVTLSPQVKAKATGTIHVIPMMKTPTKKTYKIHAPLTKRQPKGFNCM